MADVLFSNVRILDGSGAATYAGEVLVQGNRIRRVARASAGARTLPVAGVTVVDGAGATLMPGMVEAHTHFSWNDQPGLNAIQRMPTEQLLIGRANMAERYLRGVWPWGGGAAPARPRLEVVIRTATQWGQSVGPLYLAASRETGVRGGLGDEPLPPLPYPEFS